MPNAEVQMPNGIQALGRQIGVCRWAIGVNLATRHPFYPVWVGFTSGGYLLSFLAEIIRMKRVFWIIGLMAASGCSSKLETGYEPKRLDMPLSQRDALYADPYSQAAMQAQQQQQQGGGSQFHKPGAP